MNEPASEQLLRFVEDVEAAKKIRDSRDAVAKATIAVPLVRAIPLRLDPNLATFKAGGWSGCGQAIEAARTVLGSSALSQR